MPEVTNWPDAPPEMLETSAFEKVWQKIKTWDINVPAAYQGYCGATGNHVRAILDALYDELHKPIQAEIADAIQAERTRCDNIIQAARFGEVDRDWRCISSMIQSGRSDLELIEEAKS